MGGRSLDGSTSLWPKGDRPANGVPKRSNRGSARPLPSQVGRSPCVKSVVAPVPPVAVPLRELSCVTRSPGLFLPRNGWIWLVDYSMVNRTFKGSLVSQSKVDQFIRAMINRFGNEAANIALAQTHAAVPEVAASWTLIAAQVADLVALHSTNDGTAGHAEPDDAAAGQRTSADQTASPSRLSPQHPPADPIPYPSAGR